MKPSEASLLSDHINTELRRWPLFMLSIHDFKNLYEKENTITINATSLLVFFWC